MVETHDAPPRAICGNSSTKCTPTPIIWWAGGWTTGHGGSGMIHYSFYIVLWQTTYQDRLSNRRKASESINLFPDSRLNNENHFLRSKLSIRSSNFSASLSKSSLASTALWTSVLFSSRKRLSSIEFLALSRAA